jgi:hypothetical protein
VAKRTDVRNLFRKAAPKISSSDLLIADSSIIDGADKSGWQFDLTTAFEHFQITNVHRTDSYGLRAVAILHQCCAVSEWRALISRQSLEICASRVPLE